MNYLVIMFLLSYYDKSCTLIPPEFNPFVPRKVIVSINVYHAPWFEGKINGKESFIKRMIKNHTDTSAVLL